MPQAKVTNNSEAPQGVRSMGGVVYIAPGFNQTLDFSDVELDRLRTRPFLKIEDAAPPPVEATDDISLDDADRNDLKAQADMLGVDYAKNIKTDKLRELVMAKLIEIRGTPTPPVTDTVTEPAPVVTTPADGNNDGESTPAAPAS
jgi:hypothetical protein